MNERTKCWVVMDKPRNTRNLPTAVERRKFERVPLQLPIQFARANRPEEVIDCVTENISGEGIYFVSCFPLVAGERLEVDLLFPPHNSARNKVSVHLRCQVQVMRVASSGQGLGFGIACRIKTYTIQFGDSDLRRERMSKNAKA